MDGSYRSCRFGNSLNRWIVGAVARRASDLTLVEIKQPRHPDAPAAPEPIPRPGASNVPSVAIEDRELVAIYTGHRQKDGFRDKAPDAEQSRTGSRLTTIPRSAWVMAVSLPEQHQVTSMGQRASSSGST